MVRRVGWVCVCVWVVRVRVWEKRVWGVEKIKVGRDKEEKGVWVDKGKDKISKFGIGHWPFGD